MKQQDDKMPYFRAEPPEEYRWIYGKGLVKFSPPYKREPMAILSPELAAAKLREKRINTIIGLGCIGAAWLVFAATAFGAWLLAGGMG